MKELDPANLDCLAALADEGSFERAAQRLAVTQSAVSQRLRALEAAAGAPLVVRSRPLRLTDPGKILLRYARHWHAMRADLARELGAGMSAHDRLPIAVNADSLATWVLPALDPLVQEGHRQGYGLELVVDDQDFTHEWLREGAVLGCVSTVSEALRGCRVLPLGVMAYTAVASPAFIEQMLPQGLTRSNFAEVPFLVFNRKDDMQSQWVSRAFGVRSPRLRERYVPASEAYLRAVEMGWGVGVVPELQARDALAAGRLRALHPEVTLPVALYWHQWQLDAAAGPPSRRVALLDRVGDALAAGAQRALAAPRAGPARRKRQRDSGSPMR
jgi:LysR family transcriptional regulator (chromosome initiation inhibitor)